jgi:hypothetical protein
LQFAPRVKTYLKRKGQQAAAPPTVTATDPTDAYTTTDFTTATAPDPAAHDAPPSHALTANLPFPEGWV